VRAQKKKIPTAGKSFLLTLEQLGFLAEKPNASAWVREAIDEIREIRRGEKVVLARPLAEDRGSHWARLVEAGLEFRARGQGTLNSFDQVIKAALDLEEAYEEAKKLDEAAGGNGEKPFRDFAMPAYQVARDIEKIIEDGQQTRP